MQRKKLVVGNWKQNGNHVANDALLTALIASSPAAGTVVCVPFPYLAQARERLAGTGVELGAQDVSEYSGGAYTGEVSAEMLMDFDCRYAIVGHSERRSWFGDSSERVAAKAERAIAVGLVPIVCVGETLGEREQGRAEAVVFGQLDAVIERIGGAGFADVVVAYEPVWAIGTGKTATPDEAQAMHALIRGRVAESDAGVAQRLTVLYGGSVKAANAESLFACPDIDGGLIGGASLVAADFVAVCRAGLVV